MQPLLTIQNLSIDFTSDGAVTRVVEGISFTVNNGEIVAIVGESGSGKSVTALSVLQLLPSSISSTSGNIFFNNNKKNIDLLQLSKEEIQHIRGNRIAMIFQEPMTSLNPVHSCGYQVMEAILAHKKLTGEQAKAQTISLFEKVRLPNPSLIFHRYPHQLSGGQKQRVMIAMAMSCSPALLICDEPTTALDVTVQKNILQLIKSLQQQTNMSVIFITHDFGIVGEIADRIVVMYNGKIAEEGNSKTIFINPKHPYTKALLACRPALHSKGERLPVVSDFMEPENRNLKIENQEAESPVEKQSQTANFKPQTENPILKVENLEVWFPAKKTFTGKILNYTKAVDNVSFKVYSGETLGLVGESGCGKTTLGRAILGLIKPTAGKVFFKKTELTSLSYGELRVFKKDMQIIFQDPYSSLNPTKKIGDSIAEPLLVHKLFTTEKERKKKVMELLQKVNLKAEYYHRYPHEFSGGQRQRIVIARALALQPSFIVCDESVSALDISVQAQVLNLLNDLKKELGFTAIFISHDLSVIHYVCDRILVMNKGRIEETGDAEQIYHAPKSGYTKQLVASVPKILQ